MAFTLTRKTKPEDPQKLIQDCLRKRDYKGSLPAFEQLLKSSPDATQMRMRYADTLVLAGRKADAIKNYTRVAEELSESGYLVRAIAIYKKIVKLDPAQTDIVETLARLDAGRAGGDEVDGMASSASYRSGAGTGSIEIPDDGEDEFDIGGGLDLGLDLGGPIPSTTAPSFDPSRSAATAELMGDDLDPGDLDPGDLDADLAPDDLSPEADDLAPSIAAASLASDADGAVDLAPDDLSPEAEPADDELAVSTGSGFGFGPAEATETTAAGSFGAAAADLPSAGEFSFSTGPATETSAPAPASSDFSFSFGNETATDDGAQFSSPEPAAAAAGFSFGDVATDAAASLDGPAPTPAADMNDPFGMGNSGTFGTPTDQEAADLFALLGDDIDSMIDGIIDDVGNEATNAPLPMQAAETNIPLLSHLAIDEFIEILKVLDRQTVKAGKVIVQEGEAGSSMFIISSGEVVASVDKGGQSITMATLHDGDFFGEMAVLSSTPRSATVTATKNTELLVLERDSLHGIFSRHPEIEAKLRLAHDERSEKRSAYH